MSNYEVMLELQKLKDTTQKKHKREGSLATVTYEVIFQTAYSIGSFDCVQIMYLSYPNITLYNYSFIASKIRDNFISFRFFLTSTWLTKLCLIFSFVKFPKK